MTTPEPVEAPNMEPRTKLSGRVVKITLAGAVLDIGQKVPGVVHISQLRKDPVNKVEDVLHEGQAVDAWVRRVRSDRVELTMIEPLGYDWREIQPEMVVKGRVTRVEPYGAFVEFGAERPGLVHVSELTHGYVKSAAQLVKQGDEVEAKVLEVDRKKRQIRLSMKALLPEPVSEEQPRAEAKRGSKRAPKRQPAEELTELEAPKEPELTAMQVAWQEALERSKAEARARPPKAAKALSKEQDEIVKRTLENRLPTGS